MREGEGRGGGGGGRGGEGRGGEGRGGGERDQTSLETTDTCIYVYNIMCTILTQPCIIDYVEPHSVYIYMYVLTIMAMYMFSVNNTCTQPVC